MLVPGGIVAVVALCVWAFNLVLGVVEPDTRPRNHPSRYKYPFATATDGVSLKFPDDTSDGPVYIDEASGFLNVRFFAYSLAARVPCRTGGTTFWCLPFDDYLAQIQDAVYNYLGGRLNIDYETRKSLLEGYTRYRNHYVKKQLPQWMRSGQGEKIDQFCQKNVLQVKIAKQFFESKVQKAQRDREQYFQAERRYMSHIANITIEHAVQSNHSAKKLKLCEDVVQDLTAALAEKDRVIAEKERMLAENESMLAASQVENSDLREVISDLHKEIESLECALESEREKHRKDCEELVEHYSHVIASLRKELAEERDEVERLGEELRLFKLSNERLARKVNAQNEVICRLNLSNSALNQELATLYTRIAHDKDLDESSKLEIEGLDSEKQANLTLRIMLLLEKFLVSRDAYRDLATLLHGNIPTASHVEATFRKLAEKIRDPEEGIGLAPTAGGMGSQTSVDAVLNLMVCDVRPSLVELPVLVSCKKFTQHVLSQVSDLHKAGKLGKIKDGGQDRYSVQNKLYVKASVCCLFDAYFAQLSDL